MVLYNPEAAFKIYSEYPIKGDKGYSKTIQTFRENWEKFVLKQPQDFLEHGTALKIFAENAKDDRNYKDMLHLWQCYDLGISKYLNREFDNWDTLHYLSLQFLNYASRDSLLFLSSELFQALRTYTDGKVEDFLVKVSYIQIKILTCNTVINYV